MKKVLFMLAFILGGIGLATAQTSKVSGVVYSEADGEPVIGASVLVVGTDLGVATDIEGKFVIADVPASATTLRVSYMGMATQEVKILHGKTIKVILTEDGMHLDDVMVVAYGTVKKSAFTGSASVVDAEKLEDRQVSNITNALSGTMAGVQTTYSTGQPGTSSTVRIRGIGSLYASNNPLYVVDGVPFDGDISSINPSDIESMSVLKDAAAAALYGARGANGVIMVTTKKGKSHDARISFDAKWGINERQLPNYDVIESANGYMETLYQAYRNAGYYDLGYTPEAAHAYANSSLFGAVGYQMYTLNGADGLIGANGKVNPLAKLGYSDGNYFYTPDDWAAGTISSQMRQEYNLGVSGGTDRINYYFSAGYLEDGGIIENSGFNRLSTRLNVDYQAKKWLKFGANLAYTNSTSRYPGEQTNTSSSGNAFLMTDQLAPIYPMYYRDVTGKIIRDAQTGRPVYDYGDGAGADGANGDLTSFSRNYMSMSNPMSDLYYNTEEYLSDIMNSKWSAEITPLKGLKLTASLGTYIDNTRYHNIGNPKYGQSSNYGGTATQDYTRTFSMNQQYLATYNKTYGKSTYDLLAGYEAYDLRSENFYATGQNLYKEGDYTINNTIDQKRGGGSASAYSTRGILGRFNYNYDDKYFASASYRRDASSRFHPDNRWGDFYSASAAWVISKENFMRNANCIDIWKVKASFGQQGNDNIGNLYAYLDQFEVTGADGAFADGNLTYKGNKDLTWETSNSFNVGTDFSLWKSKLSGTVEYFNRTTSDMLYNKPVANSNGYSTIPMNIGSMSNYGWEIELNSNLVDRKHFNWNLYGNATMVKNKIIELHPELNGELISGSRIYREGDSMYQLYLIKYAGVDPNTGKALYYAETRLSEADATKELQDIYGIAEPSDEQIKELQDHFIEHRAEVYVTDDAQVASDTYKQVTGDLLPKVYGGFGTSLEFYGFDLSVQLSYQLGGKIYDNTYATLMHNGDGNNAGKNWHKDIANAWTPENRITDVPRLDMMDKYTNTTSDRWLVSSNYLSLNNITLGYNFPKAWLRGMGISSLRIYGVADNVALLAARKGMDPRKGFSSTSGASYGALRTFSAGVKLTF